MLGSLRTRSIQNSMVSLSAIKQTYRMMSSKFKCDHSSHSHKSSINCGSISGKDSGLGKKFVDMDSKNKLFNIRKSNYRRYVDNVLEPIHVPTFDYSKNGGNWTHICCGNRQSPIDIVTKDCVPKEIKVETEFKDMMHAELLYAHNMLQVNYNKSTLKLVKDGEETNWHSIQFHFHAPCEHSINSKLHDVEFHLVHQGIEHPDQFLVLGVMFEEDKNAPLNEFIDSLYIDELPKRNADLHVKIGDFMTGIADTQKFNYPGSLTIPPCSENVEWLLIKDTVKLPDYQVRLFTRLWAENPNFAGGKGNNREVQPLAGRKVNII